MNSKQIPALNDDQRFQRGFRDGCLNNFVPGSHSAAYQVGFNKGQHNACSEFRGGDGSSQSPSSLINRVGRNEQNPGATSIQNKHKGMVMIGLACAHLLLL